MGAIFKATSNFSKLFYFFYFNNVQFYKSRSRALIKMG